MKSSLSFFLLTLFLTTSISHADDYVWGEEFKEGDIISAETFNQIFSILQKLQRVPVDSDLTGTWSCKSTHTNNTNLSGRSNCSLKGLVYECSNEQLTLTASSASTSMESAYSISTSAPNPLEYKNTNNAFTGTYQLNDGKIYISDGGINAAMVYGLAWQDADSLKFTGVSGTVFHNINCDKTVAVPFAPTAATATNAQTLVNITWTDNSTDETGFKIYRRLSTETEATELATAVTASPYSDSTLTEGQTAYYSVAAYNDNGTSYKSKVVSATLDSS